MYSFKYLQQTNQHTLPPTRPRPATVTLSIWETLRPSTNHSKERKCSIGCKNIKTLMSFSQCFNKLQVSLLVMPEPILTFYQTFSYEAFQNPISLKAQYLYKMLSVAVTLAQLTLKIYLQLIMSANRVIGSKKLQNRNANGSYMLAYIFVHQRASIFFN